MTQETIEEKIFSAVSKKMKVHYFLAPPKSAHPYLVYTLISEVRSDMYCGPAEYTGVYQFDSYANDPLTARKQAELAFNQINFLYPFAVNSTASYEEDTGLYRYQIEFSLIYRGM